MGRLINANFVLFLLRYSQKRCSICGNWDFYLLALGIFCKTNLSTGIRLLHFLKCFFFIQIWLYLTLCPKKSLFLNGTWSTSPCQALKSTDLIVSSVAFTGCFLFFI